MQVYSHWYVLNLKLKIRSRSLGSLIPGQSIYRVLTQQEAVCFGSSALRELHGAVVLVFEDTEPFAAESHPAYKKDKHYSGDYCIEKVLEAESVKPARELLMFSWSQVPSTHSHQLLAILHTIIHNAITHSMNSSIFLVLDTWSTVLGNAEAYQKHLTHWDMRHHSLVFV